MTPTAVDHAGLIVGDLRRSIAFYCGLLGLRLLSEVEDSSAETRSITGYPGAKLRMADLACPNGDIIELIEYVEPAKAQQPLEPFDVGVAHIAFSVTDIDEVHRRLVAASVVVRSPPVALDAPGSIWHGVRAFYALDPDGRTVEMVAGRARPAPAER